MHVNQHRRHEGKPGVGDYVGRLHPPPGSVYIQQFVNRRRESRSGGRPSGKGKGATPRLWRIRRAGEFEEARVPSAPRCPEQAKTGLFEEGASLKIEDRGSRIEDRGSRIEDGMTSSVAIFYLRSSIFYLRSSIPDQRISDIAAMYQPRAVAVSG